MCLITTASSPELLAGTLSKYLWINLLSPTRSLSLTLYFVWKFQDLRQEARSFWARVGHARLVLSQNQGPLQSTGQGGPGSWLPGCVLTC